MTVHEAERSAEDVLLPRSLLVRQGEEHREETWSNKEPLGPPKSMEAALPFASRGRKSGR